LISSWQLVRHVQLDVLCLWWRHIGIPCLLIYQHHARSARHVDGLEFAKYHKLLEERNAQLLNPRLALWRN
jgi:hypothetical protein